MRVIENPVFSEGEALIMYRKIAPVLLALVLIFGLSVPVFGEEEDSITILYTNDVHTHIDNDLTYSMIAAYKDTFGAVLLADAGDHIQGTAYGGMDNGKTMTAIMNAAGYDIATLGNHEFDYGMDGCMTTVERADFPYVSCNFYYEKDGVPGEPVLDSYKVLEAGGKKIAFVGVTTPETFTSSTPAYFQDAAGNYIYGIAGGTDGAELYAAVQKSIDEASLEADYVIGLGHLGVDPGSGPWTSEALIANTTGFDAFIDGHSHHTVEMRQIADKAGNTVILTQTGSYLDAVGQMTIAADGTVTSKIVDLDDLAGLTPKAEVKALEDGWIADVDGQLGAEIAESDIEFTINGADGSRAVRETTTNLTDFNADAYYWYLCGKEGLDCDFAVNNGGGVRATVPSGNWTYNSCRTVNPFGNVLCIVEVSGQEILDALEFGARSVGEGENGGLLHAAGLIYEVNTSVEDTVQVDDKGVWTGSPEAYRVTNVKIYDKASGEFKALDLDKTYRMGGSNYTLRSQGDGFAMLKDTVLYKDYIVEDYIAMAEYSKAFKDTDGDGLANLTSAGSPLAAYKGYLLNYENPAGSGRMMTVTTPAEEPEAPPVIEPAPVLETGTYTVVSGDSLWKIARAQYGNGSQWKAIYEANKEIIKNPNLIYAGQKLMIPAV